MSSDWVALFERFGNGEDTALDEMQTASLDLTAVHTLRWLLAASNALGQRLALLSDGLQERQDRCTAGADTVAGLDWVREQLVPLYRFSCVPSLPDWTRAHIADECRRWVERTQASVELRAARVNDQGLLALMVRRTPLRWPPVASQTPPNAMPGDDRPKPRRNILRAPDG
jgi:hypothetical protein